jgi:hypothetical protein
MSIRVKTLVLMMSLALATGCPGGDSDGEGDGNSGTGGASGAGGSGSGGGGSGGGGSGTGGGNANMSPEDVASGSCDTMGGSGGTECTGIEEYQACLNDTCGYAQCYSGPCADYLECLGNADDPCTAASPGGECSPSSECTSCFTTNANCALNCASNLDCGGSAGQGGAAGTGGLPEGTCADLDACCATLPSAEETMTCTAAADAARMAGDSACAIYIIAFCP